MSTTSVFDLLASLAWGFSSAANLVDDDMPVHSENGTDATCKLQAFGISLGYRPLCSMFHFQFSTCW